MAKRPSLLTVVYTISMLLLPLHSHCSAGCHGGGAEVAAGCGDNNKAGKKQSQQQQVEGVFVFGSSLVDNGNNNFLNGSVVRADYLPYGVDFPLGPTGRFSNGRNAIDALGELLGLPGLVPPFANPATRGRAVLHGVNYASGGSGILDSTGQLTGAVTNLRQQIANFETVTLPDLRAQMHGMRGRQDSVLEDYLSKCLFIIGTGGNDYLLNYFNPRNVAIRPPVSVFTASLIIQLSEHLQKLYSLGARKFVVFSIQPNGCTPVVRSFVNFTGAACIEPVNLAVDLFNSELRLLIDGAGSCMPDARFSNINSYRIIRDILDHPAEQGLTETGSACCEISKGSGGVLCVKGGRICGDRSKYLFFDGLHPTDAVNAVIAREGYGSKSPELAYPINVEQLAML